MKKFNLVDEKWIPVRMIDGTYNELNMKEVFLLSKEIASLEDSSPLVLASLHRFLLAVLYRAIGGPKDFEESRNLFDKGINKEKINSYLDKWYDRFWLYHEDNPFYQVPNFLPKEWRSWTTLTAEHNADNAKVLFDHSIISNPGKILSNRAVRYLLATQTFSLSCGKSELSHTATSPSATGVMAIPIGRDLEDTLLYLLLNQNEEILKLDLPVWERLPEELSSLKKGFSRAITGYTDLYTWRSRAIFFRSSNDEQLSQVAFASGIGHQKTEMLDPMVVYRKDKKLGILPLQFKNRGIWRDFDSLLPGNGELAPQVIENAIRLSRNQPDRFPNSILVLGQSNNKAKVEFWRMERFVLSKALITNQFIRSDIRKIIDLAEEMSRILLGACSVYAVNYLAKGNLKPEASKETSFISQIICNSYYWSLVEASFYHVISSYSENDNPDLINKNWSINVSNAAKLSWNKHKESVLNNSSNIKAIIKSDDYFLAKVSVFIKNNIDVSSKDIT